MTSISKPAGSDPKNQLRRLIGRFVTHSAQHVIVAPVEPGGVAEAGPVDDYGTECSVVESPARLEAAAALVAACPCDAGCPACWRPCMR